MKRRRRDQPAVSGNLVSGLKCNDVTGHQVLCRELDELTIPSCLCLHDEHLLQGSDTLGRLALLVKTQDGVEDSQRKDKDPGREVLEGDDADDRHANQNQLHQVSILAQERFPTRLRRLFGQAIRAVLLASLR